MQKSIIKQARKISRASRSLLLDQRPRFTFQDQHDLQVLNQYWF